MTVSTSHRWHLVRLKCNQKEIIPAKFGLCWARSLKEDNSNIKSVWIKEDRQQVMAVDHQVNYKNIRKKLMLINTFKT